MADEKPCPRCGGTLAPGSLKEIGHFGNSPYEWVPDGDAPFALKGAPKTRQAVVAHRCKSCGYVELSAP
jgi:hypothetical protein